MREVSRDHLSESFDSVVGCDPALIALSKGNPLRGRFTILSLPASGSDFTLDTNSKKDVAGAGRHMQRVRRDDDDKSSDNEDCYGGVVCLMLAFNCPLNQHHHDEMPVDSFEPEYTSPHIH